ncbi:MAG: FAD-dependent oxidoreductase, partial [Acidimicrobiales bacterium]|nr:FAD-dependent oxidoreductase [Acidimicrobiales bacterium]
MERHDLIVIGGGPGGIAAADAALRRGAATLVVQDGPMGGDCTFTGCVPSKTLISSAARGRSRTEAMAAVGEAVTRIAAMEDADTFRRRGATVVEGRARFLTRDVIEVDGRRFRSDRVIIATGAAPIVPPIDGLRDSEPLTNENLWDVDALPASIAVLGGGPIGIELAQALGRLGVAVTVFEAMDQILGREDPETARLVTESLRNDGVDVRVGGRVQKVERVGSQRAIHTDDGRSVDADEVLVAIGRR